MALTHFSFCDVGITRNGIHMVVPDGDSVTCAAIAPTTSNAQTAAGAKPFVRVATDTAVYVAFGTNPNAETATTARYFMPANTVEIFQIEIGYKCAAVSLA